jgi:two-component system response regulator PilR (NtrC family)
MPADGPFQTRKSLLLIDDEQDILGVIGSFFGRSGYEVDCAATAGEAYSRLADRAYDLVITDLCLTAETPNQGLEIVDHVRRHSPATRVALLTGYGSPEIESEALRRGAHAFFQKTQPMRDIAREVASLLGVGAAQGGQKRA